MKYDDSYFYAIVDFISVSTASGTDGVGIQFDTNNDGGNNPKPDDYRFDADYRGQGSNTSIDIPQDINRTFCRCGLARNEHSELHAGNPA